MLAADPIQILVVDDQPIVRMGLVMIVKMFDDLELVGEARNGIEAVWLCRQLKPDVVLMDLLMPEMDGLAATRIIRQECPASVVLVLTSLSDPGTLAAALDAGAIECMAKGIPVDELVTAVRRAAASSAMQNQHTR